MMGSVMKDLFYGFFDSGDGKHRQEPGYICASKREDELCAKLTKALGKNEEDLFQKYVEAHWDVEELELLEKFSSGLKFGVMLMAECFREMDEKTLGGDA